MGRKASLMHVGIKSFKVLTDLCEPQGEVLQWFFLVTFPSFNGHPSLHFSTLGLRWQSLTFPFGESLCPIVAPHYYFQAGTDVIIWSVLFWLPSQITILSKQIKTYFNWFRKKIVKPLPTLLC